MALPNDLGNGASGFHGDAAVKVRSVLAAAEAVQGNLAQLPALIAALNALLEKLDADAGVSDTDYASLLQVLPVTP